MRLSTGYTPKRLSPDAICAIGLLFFLIQEPFVVSVIYIQSYIMNLSRNSHAHCFLFPSFVRSIPIRSSDVLCCKRHLALELLGGINNRRADSYHNLDIVS